MLRELPELKFVVVRIDKNLNWYIKLVESKISKNIRVLFKGSLHLNKKCLLMICLSFIRM